MLAQRSHGAGAIWIDVARLNRATATEDTAAAAPGRSSKALWLSVGRGARAAALFSGITTQAAE